jgi:uncharacterized membrane protein YfcA
VTTTATPDQQFWRIVAVGVLAGFTSGLFGVGGGIVMVPALVLLVGFAHKLATGTSLNAIIPISVSGIIGYALDGEVDFAAAAFVAIGAVAGAIVGTRWLRRIHTPVLQLVFAGVMVATAVRMLFGDPEASGRGDITVLAAIALIVLGIVSGVLAGLLGVGGGIIIVPALTIFFGIPHVLAKGTSLAIILPTAISGTIQNHRAALTSMRAATIIGVAGIVSAFLASQLSLGLSPRVSQALFAGLLVVAAIRVGREGARDLRAARTDDAVATRP